MYSVSLAAEEIKTAFYLIPVRMTIIWKTNDNNSMATVKKKNHHTLLMGRETVTVAVEIRMGFLKRQTIGLVS